MFAFVVRALICFFLVSTAFAAEKLQEFKGAEFVPTEYNDGDSFRVRFVLDGKTDEQVVRLYFVDAFEQKADSTTNKRRLLEQTRYFGFSDENRRRGMEFGTRAKVRVEELLSKPFTLYTSFASALGRSKKPRIYGMIKTADGQDLAALLVREGLARVHGVGHRRPDGLTSKDYEQLLGDLQLEAAVKKLGAWAVSDFDRIAELREEQRADDRKLKLSGGTDKDEESGPIDLNTASQEDLERLKGIKSKLAQRIVEQRPYKSIDDLSRVSGIGPKLLEKLRPHITVEPAANTEKPAE